VIARGLTLRGVRAAGVAGVLLCAVTAAAAQVRPGGLPGAVPGREGVPEVAAEEGEDALSARFAAQWRAGELAGAEATLLKLLEVARFKGVAWYNLACVRCKRGQTELAEAALRSAVEAGFVDFSRAQRELRGGGDLACLAGGDMAAAIVEGAAELQDAVLKARLAGVRKLSGSDGPQLEARDEARRLVVISGHSERALGEARVEIEGVWALWRAWVTEEDGAGQVGAEGARGARLPEPWVIVWLPKPDVFAAWARREVGPGAGTIGGLYRPLTHELVARDLGPTLRHELWHVLHHRAMSRLGQEHPVWVQEGLCALVEDVAWGEAGKPGGVGEAEEVDAGAVLAARAAAAARPAQNWRSNMARRMLESGNMPRLRELVLMSDRRFMESGSLGRYAVARTLMVYLHSRGELGAFWTALVETFDEDRTGAAALERATGQKLDALDKEFRVWVRGLAVVPEAGQIGASSARLPFDVDERGGEGLTVLELDAAAMLKFGVAPGEVLVAVDGKQVRDAHELVRALSARSAGDEVELTLRRGRGERRVKVMLIRERN